MSRSRQLGAAAMTLVALALPDAAAAAGGVTVDPQSPAGVQYQIPLGSARSNAAGGTSAGAASAGRSSGGLFGVGIVPPTRSGADGGRQPVTGGGRLATSGDQAAPSPQPQQTGGGAGSADPATAAAVRRQPASGSLVTLVAVVLAAGGCIGLVLLLGARYRSGRRHA